MYIYIFIHASYLIYHNSYQYIEQVMIGHCFGHQSGQDRSSGRKFTIFKNSVEFRVYPFVPNVFTNTTYI